MPLSLFYRERLLLTSVKGPLRPSFQGVGDSRLIRFYIFMAYRTLRYLSRIDIFFFVSLHQVGVTKTKLEAAHSSQIATDRTGSHTLRSKTANCLRSGDLIRPGNSGLAAPTLACRPLTVISITFSIDMKKVHFPTDFRAHQTIHGRLQDSSNYTPLALYIQRASPSRKRQ